MNWFYCYSWWWDDTAPVGIEQKPWGDFCSFSFCKQDFKNFNLVGLCFREAPLLSSFTWELGLLCELSIAGWCEAGPLQLKLYSRHCDPSLLYFWKKNTKSGYRTHIYVFLWWGKCIFVEKRMYLYIHIHIYVCVYIPTNQINNFKQSLHVGFFMHLIENLHYSFIFQINMF